MFYINVNIGDFTSGSKKDFQGRGTKIEGGRITEYMSKLLPSLNQEDFILDVEDGDPYEVQFGFVFS